MKTTDKLDSSIIEKAGLADFVVHGIKYHESLPPELEPFYCYVSDGGHSIVVVLKNKFVPGTSINTYLVAVPVKTVIRHGYG